MPATINVSGNCIEVITTQTNLYPKGSLTITTTNATTYQINFWGGGVISSGLTASNTTFNGIVYPSLSDLFAAFKSALF